MTRFIFKQFQFSYYDFFVGNSKIGLKQNHVKSCLSVCLFLKLCKCMHKFFFWNIQQRLWDLRDYSVTRETLGAICFIGHVKWRQITQLFSELLHSEPERQGELVTMKPKRFEIAFILTYHFTIYLCFIYIIIFNLSIMKNWKTFRQICWKNSCDFKNDFNPLCWLDSWETQSQ